MRLSGTQIEVQFIERPSSSTFGDLTVNEYESLLKQSHSEIMTSPFCGQDRWMGNNFGYNTWALAGGLDLIYPKLLEKEVKFKLSKFPIEYASDYNKEMLAEIGFGGKFMVGMFVVDPSGHAIHSVGTLEDKDIIGRTPLYDHQCATECEDEMDVAYDHVLFDINGILKIQNVEMSTMIYIIFASFAVVVVRSIWLLASRKKALQSTQMQMSALQRKYGAIMS